MDGSDVELSAAIRLNTRRFLLLSAAVVAVAGRSSREETQKKAPSPRQLMRGRPSSWGEDLAWEASGEVEDVETEGMREAAADLPTDPWNWVDFSPQPTFTGASAFHVSALMQRRKGKTYFRQKCST